MKIQIVKTGTRIIAQANGESATISCEACLNKFPILNKV